MKIPKGAPTKGLRLGKQGSWTKSQGTQAHQRQGRAPGWARRGCGTPAEGSPLGVHPGGGGALSCALRLNHEVEGILGRGPVPVRLTARLRGAHLLRRSVRFRDTCAGRAWRRARLAQSTPARALGAGTTGGGPGSEHVARALGAGTTGGGDGGGAPRGATPGGGTGAQDWGRSALGWGCDLRHPRLRTSKAG